MKFRQINGKKCFSFLLMMCIAVAAFVGAGFHKVQAANPRLMVSDYAIEGGEVLAGEEFVLSITLKNTASSSVKNVKLTVMTEQGEMLPVEGAGTAYIGKIDGNQEAEFTFQMLAIEGLEEKSYKLSLKTEYEGSNGMEYTVEEAIFIPVTLEQRVSVTDIFIPESYIELGDTVEISASVNNLGDGTLYNVTAKVEGTNIGEAENYIGNIESGKSGTIDILTKSTAISKEFGDSNSIIITYEDRKGNVQEAVFEIGVEVNQPVFENLEKVKEEPKVGAVVGKIAAIVGVVAVVGLIAWWMIRRYQKKKKILEEF